MYQTEFTIEMEFYKKLMKKIENQYFVKYIFSMIVWFIAKIHIWDIDTKIHFKHTLF